MKHITCLLVQLLLCISIGSTAKVPVKKKINVAYNRTIETIMILRAISSEDYFLKRIDSGFKGRPLLYSARKFFAPYKGHPAVAATQKILADASDIGGLLFQGVLYAEELPGANIKYETKGYWKMHKAELAAYMKTLQQFYHDAKVAQFLKDNKRFYDGAIAEAKGFMNDDIITAMEKFFGKENNSYTLLVMPLCPYGWGFSTTTGKNQYAIVAPVGNIDWKDNVNAYQVYGYGGDKAKEHYRELVTHEFAHSFITDVLEKETLKKQINQYDSLYTPELAKEMDEQGYGDWWGFVNEYIVRLSEIRVAASLNEEEANEMRRVNIEENKFVLLPDGESLIRQYEQNRQMYKTIDEFLPALIQQLSQFDKKTINDKLKKVAKAN